VRSAACPQATLEAAIPGARRISGIAAGASGAELTYVVLKAVEPPSIPGESKSRMHTDSSGPRICALAHRHRAQIRGATQPLPLASYIPCGSTNYGKYITLARVRNGRRPEAHLDPEVFE